MHSFCLLTSMELNPVPNYSLLYLHSNYLHSNYLHSNYLHSNEMNSL